MHGCIQVWHLFVQSPNNGHIGCCILLWQWTFQYLHAYSQIQVWAKLWDTEFLGQEQVHFKISVYCQIGLQAGYNLLVRTYHNVGEWLFLSLLLSYLLHREALPIFVTMLGRKWFNILKTIWKLWLIKNNYLFVCLSAKSFLSCQLLVYILSLFCFYWTVVNFVRIVRIHYVVRKLRLCDMVAVTLCRSWLPYDFVFGNVLTHKLVIYPIIWIFILKLMNLTSLKRAYCIISRFVFKCLIFSFAPIIHFKHSL